MLLGALLPASRVRTTVLSGALVVSSAERTGEPDSGSDPASIYLRLLGPGPAVAVGHDEDQVDDRADSGGGAATTAVDGVDPLTRAGGGGNEAPNAPPGATSESVGGGRTGRAGEGLPCRISSSAEIDGLDRLPS